MEIQKFNIQGLLLITPQVYRDDRGHFAERFNEKKFRELNLPYAFVQDNYSHSLPGVLRGLHYQSNPSQGKLVSCTKGRIFDVAVDIRKNSPTFGQWVSVELSSEIPQHFWIPAGFAHGFCVMGSEPADVMYKVDNFYSAASEGCLVWNDPDLSIPWPVAQPKLSGKDHLGMRLRDYAHAPVFELRA